MGSVAGETQDEGATIRNELKIRHATTLLPPLLWVASRLI
jgi:hypothetical protein